MACGLASRFWFDRRPDSTQERRGNTLQMPERPRLLVLDVLESFARERDIDVFLERWNDRSEWFCLLSENRTGFRGTGRSAREAIKAALRQAGVELPG